jgi:pilus assembly protein CpaB
MFVRNILLAVGAVCVLAGLGIIITWYGRERKPAALVETPGVAPQQAVAVMVAKRKIPVGKSLQNDDISSKDVGPGEVPPHENILRGQETEFLGRSSLHEYTEGQPLIASDFIKPCTKLSPAQGYRAISIFVDQAQSVAGLAVPGDYVDVLLTQTFADSVTTDPRRKWAGETVLRDVQVLATDQSLCPPSGVILNAAAGTSARTPQTVTLALKERQAEVLMVAGKLGTFQLAVRPIESAGAVQREDNHKAKPVWASDVSSALTEILTPPPPPLGMGPPPQSPCPTATCSPLEHNVRCAPSKSAYYRVPVAPKSEAPKSEAPNSEEAPEPEPNGQWPGRYYAPEN